MLLERLNRSQYVDFQLGFFWIHAEFQKRPMWARVAGVLCLSEICSEPSCFCWNIAEGRLRIYVYFNPKTPASHLRQQMMYI